MAAACLATGASIVAGCTSGEPENAGTDAGQQPRGAVVVGTAAAFPENLSPLVPTGSADAGPVVREILGQILPAAFRVQPDLTVEFDGDLLSTEPVAQVDGTMEVVYEVDPDAVWSDGTPITADDFEFSWRVQRTVDPAQGGCPGLVIDPAYAPITAVEGEDDGRTVRVTYPSVVADWRAAFARILPAHVLDVADPAALCAALGAGWSIADGLPADISGGPWQLSATGIDTGQQSLTLRPNPEYWGRPPGLAELTYRSYDGDTAAALAALAEGELQVLTLGSETTALAGLDDVPDLESMVTPVQTFEELVLNGTNVHLADPAVRRALALTLDRTAIAGQVGGSVAGEAEVANNRIFLANQSEATRTAPEEFETPDPDEAAAQLEGAGYVRGGDGVFAHPERGRLSFAVSFSEGPAQTEAVSSMIVQAAAAGIELVERTDPALTTTLESGSFDVAVKIIEASPFASSAAARYLSPGLDQNQNASGFGNAEVDDLAGQLVAETDPGDYAALGNQIDELLWADLPTIPLYQHVSVTMHAEQLRGVAGNPVSGLLWNSATWTYG